MQNAFSSPAHSQNERCDGGLYINYSDHYHIIAKKKDASNKVTNPDHYHIPLVNELLGELKGQSSLQSLI